MMKKLIAILVVLATMLSFAACGKYEISVEKKGDETKAASDSVDKKEDKTEEEENRTEKETEAKPTEKQTEKVTAAAGEEEHISTFDEVYDYLSAFVNLEGYANKPVDNNDTIYSYSVSYDENKTTAFDFSLKINGKALDLPAKYANLKNSGLTFSSSMYNEKSEQNGETYARSWDFNVPGGGQVRIESVNLDSYAKPVTDLDFYGIRLYGYSYESDTRSFEKKNAFSKSAINDTITLDSTIEDVIAEFGTPNSITISLSKYRTRVSLKYTEGTGYSTEYLTFDFNFDNGVSKIEEAVYEYPYSEV